MSLIVANRLQDVAIVAYYSKFWVEAI